MRASVRAVRSGKYANVYWSRGKRSRIAAGGPSNSAARVSDHFTGRFAIVPPKRYFDVTDAASDAPASGRSTASVVLTSKSGRRYAATRNPPLISFSQLPVGSR